MSKITRKNPGAYAHLYEAIDAARVKARSLFGNVEKIGEFNRTVEEIQRLRREIIAIEES